ncbi:hypothetical protein Ahy_B02g061387 [Arachis hypogaea]|uniref:Uncharacterized protein n=1 Tax=Arachis hypogaea TaxID=3818 RepID=A0A445AKS8_ARAHY|nr:hypothetical protein Ahy_B02g061387 [Arachis hypogaea]
MTVQSCQNQKRGLMSLQHELWKRFVVDLLAETCNCRFWGLCEMPSPHACCAIFDKGDNLENCCSNFYNPTTYLATYGKLVFPINRKNMWPKMDCDTIIPPIFRVKARRPRMVRIREPNENQTKFRRMEPDATATNRGDAAGLNGAAAVADDGATVDIAAAANTRSGVNICRFEKRRQIGIGRDREKGRGRSRGRNTVVSSQPLPTTPVATSSQSLPITAAAASTQPPPIVATSDSQTPTLQPLLPVVAADSQQPSRASSQTLPKIKVLGVRKSG